MDCFDLITIVQGSDRSFFVDLFYPDSDTPFDLTSVSEIEVTFPTISSPSIKKTLTSGAVEVLGQPGAGRIRVTITHEDSAAMRTNPVPEEPQDLQVAVEMPSDITVIVIPGVLNIQPQAYPS